LRQQKHTSISKRWTVTLPSNARFQQTGTTNCLRPLASNGRRLCATRCDHLEVSAFGYVVVVVVVGAMSRDLKMVCWGSSVCSSHSLVCRRCTESVRVCPVTHHTSHVTRYPSHVTRYPSHVTRYTSVIHTSHVTPLRTSDPPNTTHPWTSACNLKTNKHQLISLNHCISGIVPRS
jgi:hypothetical protein